MSDFNQRSKGVAFSFAIYVAIFSMGASAQEIIGSDFRSESIHYRCAGGKKIQVAYLNLTDGRSFASLHHGGKTALLQAQTSASGALYVALDEAYSLRWHTKGNTGTLRFLEADHTAHEKILLKQCKTVKP